MPRLYEVLSCCYLNQVEVKEVTGLLWILLKEGSLKSLQLPNVFYWLLPRWIWILETFYLLCQVSLLVRQEKLICSQRFCEPSSLCSSSSVTVQAFYTLRPHKVSQLLVADVITAILPCNQPSPALWSEWPVRSDPDDFSGTEVKKRWRNTWLPRTWIPTFSTEFQSKILEIQLKIHKNKGLLHFFPQ